MLVLSGMNGSLLKTSNHKSNFEKIFKLFRDVEIFDDQDDSVALEKIEQVIQTNFTGLVHCTRKAFRLIEKTNDYGLIVNIGSIAGHFIPPINFKFNVYPGTKHAVRATTEVIRRELVKRNNKKIRVAVSFSKYNSFKNK